MMLRRGRRIFRGNHDVHAGRRSWGGWCWGCGRLLASLGLKGVHLCNQVADVHARSLMPITRLSFLGGDLSLCTMEFSANSARRLARGAARREGRELVIRVR